MAKKLTKKQVASIEYENAVDSLREYRGLPVDSNAYDYRIEQKTVAGIESATKAILAMIGQPVQDATEKQIALLVKFSNRAEHEELKGVENWKLNKYQASELIGLYISIDDIIRNARYYSVSDVEVTENRIYNLIAKIEK